MFFEYIFFGTSTQKILTHMSEDFFIILCFSLLLAPIFLRAESATFRVAKAFCAPSALFSYFYMLNICVCLKGGSSSVTFIKRRLRLPLL